MTSATAWPPDSPGYQACRIASQLSVSGVNAIAEPEQFTYTTLFPDSFNAFRQLRCTDGNSMLVRSPFLKPGYDTGISSPSSWPESPPTKITTSYPLSFLINPV